MYSDRSHELFHTPQRNEALRSRARRIVSRCDSTHPDRDMTWARSLPNRRGITSDREPAVVTLPLLPIQQGLLAESLSRPGQGVNIEQIVLRYSRNAPARDRIEAAWRDASGRFDALRLAIGAETGGALRQCLLPISDIRIRFLDWQTRSDPEVALQEWLAQDRQTGFALDGTPLWRLTCLGLEAGAMIVVWTIHHAVIDLASMARILDDVGARLSGQRPQSGYDVALPPIAAQIATVDKTPALDHFRRHLAGFESVNQFAATRLEPFADHLFVTRVLGPDLRKRLDLRAQQSGATITNIVQLAFGLVLARWTGQDRATFGLTQAVWAAMPAARAATGCLIATHPFHQHMPAVATLGAHLRDLRRETVAHRTHMALPMAAIRSACDMAADLQVFDAVLSVVPAALGDLLHDPHWQGVDVSLLERGAAGVTLAVHLDPALELVLEHDTSCLSAEQAERFLRHIGNVLVQIAQAADDTALGALDMLGADERALLLARAQPDHALPSTVPCIATRFAQIAASQPDETALICAQTGTTLTYRILDQMANGVAHALHLRGISEGSIVVLDLPRGVGFVAAMLGVLKVGAAFLPLDPTQETTLKAGLIAQSGAELVLGQGGLNPETLPPQPAPPATLAPAADRRAYVIYTSGSTGKPKGVMGACGALSAHADATALAFGLTQQDRCLCFAGLAFDVVLEEILPSLLAGAQLVLRNEGAAQSLSSFRALVARHQITVLNLPASFWHVLEADMSAGGAPIARSVRLVVTGSERINPDALARWQQLLPHADWMNGYGPTEATITAASFHLPAHAPVIDPSQDVPIGRPMAHARCHIRALDGSLAPDGAEGLLWIGGPSVTLGYLNNPDETDRVFHADPFAPEGRLYNTGDRARWGSDGQLRFLGRRDRQVKLRGHRIDLTGAERVLAALPGVQQAHVALDRAGTAQARLLAWLVLEAGQTAPDLRHLRVLSARDLPLVAIPHLILVSDLPVTANGKVATALLPRPDMVAPVRLAPSDPLTGQVADLMAQVLGLDAVSADDDFHDLGGESLAAVRFAALVEQHLNRAVAAMDLYQHPTAASFAAFLREGSTGPRYIVPIQPHGTQPAFFAVHVLGPKESQWRPLAEALGPDWPVFGITVGAPRNLDDIDIPAIAEVYFQEIQIHHPKGPLILGATSMASYYAYDLAQRLIAAGRDVRLMVAFDAMGPSGRPAVAGWDKLRAHLSQLSRHGYGHLQAIWQARALRRQIARDGAESPEGEVTGFNIVEATVQAVERYQPAPISAPILVFRADTSFWDSREALQTCLGWSQVAAGGVRMVDVPGEHLTILEPQNVGVLAARLKDVIDAQTILGTAHRL
jgi:amino acid adenylation domain-containing protein